MTAVFLPQKWRKIMMKKVLAFVLALAMAASLLACNSTPKSDDKTTAGTESAKADDKTEAAETKADDTKADDTKEAEGEPAELRDGELYVDPDPEKWPTIVVEVCSFTDEQEAEAEIEAALNDYLVSINAGFKVDMLSIAFGDRSTRLTLMLADNNDPIDVFGFRWYSSVTNMVKNQQIISLEKYKDIYPGLLEVYPEDIYRTCMVNGELYSIPAGGCFGQQEVYVLRKDIAEEIDVMDLVDTKITIEQLEEIMTKAEAAHPELCWMGDPALTPFLNIDDLGNDRWLGVLENRGVGAKEVINYYESDAYYETALRGKRWADAGFFRDDPLNNNYAGATDINDGICGGFMFEAFDPKYAYTLMRQQVTEHEMVVFYLSDWAGTNSCVYNGFSISSVCKYPDAAMKFLYLFYTDENVLRYFSLGKEGLTYKILEDGTATYADGKDSTNVGWNCTAPWFYANETLSIPFDTDFVDMYDLMKEINQDSSRQYSDGMGFIFDDSSVFDEVAACTSVVDEYRKSLNLGQVSDVDSYIASFREELKEAGIDKIVEAMNAQYQEFLANK